MCGTATCMSPQSEDDIELYRNITSTSTILAFLACTIDTMHLLGITFILYNYRVWVNSTQTHGGVCSMAQWLVQWTPIGDH